MKKSRIIIPALGVLILSTAASITGTVAWFSMNTKATLTGMVVKTKVGDSLLISADNTEANFRSGLDQERRGTLEPVSTINGVNFFYTVDAKADGDASSDNYVAYNESTNLDNTAAGKTKQDAAFQTAYGNTSTVTTENVVYGFIDYSFYLKGTNSASENKVLAMSSCNLTYQGAALGANDKAWRVALFAVATTAGTTVTDADAAVSINNLTMLTRSGSSNFTANKAVKDATHVDTLSYGALVGEEPNQAPKFSEYNKYADLGTVNAGATAYYKVVVRLWLEGEDNKCTNETYATLTGDYRLDLAFDFVASDAHGANSILSTAVVAVSPSNLVATITLSDGKLANGETPVSYQWYNASNDSAISQATQSTYTAEEAMSVYCLVTTARGSVYRSNTVALANA